MSKKKTRQAELSVTVRLDILLGIALQLNHIKVLHNLFLKKDAFCLAKGTAKNRITKDKNLQFCFG